MQAVRPLREGFEHLPGLAGEARGGSAIAHDGIGLRRESALRHQRGHQTGTGLGGRAENNVHRVLLSESGHSPAQSCPG